MLTKIKVGDRVKVNFIGGDAHLVDALGTVFYIHEADWSKDWFAPIQVELDEPWTEHGQRMLRVSRKEVSVVE